MEEITADNDMSLYGLANAVTRHSQSVESYDRATTLRLSATTSCRCLPHNGIGSIRQPHEQLHKKIYIKFGGKNLCLTTTKTLLMETGTNFLLPDMAPSDDVFSEEDLSENLPAYSRASSV